MENHPTIRQWLNRLDASKLETVKNTPNYWSSDPSCLITMSNISNLSFGTGHSIYANTILPAIASASTEVILVTCFWARSPTLDSLNSTLLSLSTKASQQGRRIRVRICFSSLSLFQKLFHTSSLEGRMYTPSEWQRTLGLPSQEELEGLDLEIKSIFIRPFSVMHPKLIIIDRKRVFLPSCNVSWEAWFEGCINIGGEVVERFVEFWLEFWASERDQQLRFPYSDDQHGVALNSTMPASKSSQHTVPRLLFSSPPRLHPRYFRISSIFLPSPHHRNPNFSLLPWRPCPEPPPTPLNAFLLPAFSNARKDIYIQTPNLTSPPVLSALLVALKSGVDVTIVTSERLMILEQLVTAGTTTSRCLRLLIKRHKRLLRLYRKSGLDTSSDSDSALEAGGFVRPGNLQISFYQPDPAAPRNALSEPTQSHLKLTIIDGEWTVLGSGNLDRASWYTSQELDVAFFSKEFAVDVRRALDPLMERRKRLVYDGRVSES